MRNLMAGERGMVDGRLTWLCLFRASRALGIDPQGSPKEHLNRLANGSLFAGSGVAGFLDGIPRPDPLSVDEETAAWLFEESARSASRPIGDLYMKVVPRRLRHASGEYFTPQWLVEHVLDRAGFDQGKTFLDPMCGAGAFLSAAIRRIRRWRGGEEGARILEAILAQVHGSDINPLAVLMARVTYLEAIADLPRFSNLPIPVTVTDAILKRNDEPDQKYDVVAGNPPWVGWESLSDDLRAATKSLWVHHGLFPEKGGMGVMLGRGKKDLSMLATYAAADRFLDSGGRLAFVINRSVLKSVGAGAGFRRFVLGDGTPLHVVSVDDFGARSVFAGATAKAAVILIEKGAPTLYPVPFHVWHRKEHRSREEGAIPLDPHDPGSVWLTGSSDRLQTMRPRLGPSDYRARAGAYSGGANGVYWVTRHPVATGRPGRGPKTEETIRVTNLAGSGKRPVDRVTRDVEPELLFPLLRASGIRWLHAEWNDWLLLPQDPSRRRGIDLPVMKERYPQTLAWFEMFREVLDSRRDRGTRSLVDAGAPFYSMFSVSTETLAAWKVVWPRIASRLNAAPVGPAEGKPVVPQETCTFVACRSEEEACYLAGILSSDLFNDIAAAFAQPGSKSFGAPHLLRNIAVRRYDPARPEHRKLADAVKQKGPGLPPAALEELVENAWARSASIGAAHAAVRQFSSITIS